MGNRQCERKPLGCLNSVGGARRWDNYPYYAGPCPDAEGCYREDDHDGPRRRGHCRRREDACGMFLLNLPVAVAANGILPLINAVPCDDSFCVNSGMITLETPGTYLATYTVRVPEGQTVDTMMTLNVNDASQSSAIAMVGGEGPACYTAQAIFRACERTMVTLRSSEAINLTATSPQPLATLSLMRMA